AGAVVAGQEGAVQVGGQDQPPGRGGVRAARQRLSGNIGHRVLQVQRVSFSSGGEGTGGSVSGSSSSAVGVVRSIGWKCAGCSGAGRRCSSRARVKATTASCMAANQAGNAAGPKRRRSEPAR